MLLSHSFRFIYTKTAKTASTSVESFFEEFCMPDGEWKESHGRDEYESSAGIIGYRGSSSVDNLKWWSHMPASQIKDNLEDGIWDNYFKFCVVRNPFEKCVSSFAHYRMLHANEQEPMTRFSVSQAINVEQAYFIEFLQKHAPKDRDVYTINNKFCLDDFIRYESLDNEVERICKKLQVPYLNKKLPTFKRGIRTQDQTIERLYTKRSRRLVEDMYSFELSYFNYKFP